MESMFILVPISIILAFIIGLVFPGGRVKTGQFDDLEGPAAPHFDGRRLH